MITIENLSYHYPKSTKPSLNNIHLKLSSGEALGLLGPNGAGKTTLMLLLSGLLPIQQGTILFNGTPLHKLNKKQRQKIALVPQDFAFYPNLSVWDNLKFFASLYHIKQKQRLYTLLEQTNLISHHHKLAKQLSGGLKRRLNFAIGIINQPELIFLDEITVGIDPESRQFILNSIQQLTQEGISIIYTSHYLQEIEQLCNNIALLNQGSLIYHGKLSHILQQQTTPIQITTTPPISLEHAQQLQGSLKADGSFICIHSNPDKLLTFLQQHHYHINACQFGYTTLEQFYLNFLNQQSPC